MAGSRPYRGDAARGEIEILEERLVYESPFGRVYDDRVLFPSGREGRHFRFRWTGPYSVCVLPVMEDGSVALVENFRHGDRRWRLEIVRGLGEEGLSPEDMALRELREELGMQPRVLEKVREIGPVDRREHLFLARGSRVVASPDREDGEAIEGHRLFSRDELPSLLTDGRVNDSDTLFLLSWICAGR